MGTGISGGPQTARQRRHCCLFAEVLLPCEFGMTRETVALLGAFDHLPFPLDSGPLEDGEVGTALSALFHFLDEQDAKPTWR